MKVFKIILKSGTVFIGLFLIVHASNAKLEINTKRVDQHWVCKKEKLKDLHVRITDQWINVLKFALDGKHNLANALNKDVSLREEMDKLLEDGETALLFKAKMDEIILQKYPQCTKERMELYRGLGQHLETIGCLEIFKAAGIEAIDRLSFQTEEIDVMYHDNLDNLRKDSFVIIDNGDTIEFYDNANDLKRDRSRKR